MRTEIVIRIREYGLMDELTWDVVFICVADWHDSDHPGDQILAEIHGGEYGPLQMCMVVLADHKNAPGSYDELSHD